MRLVLFLTFVLLSGFFSSLALASPDSAITPKKIGSGAKSSWGQENDDLIASRSSSPHSLSASLGYMAGPLVDSGENRTSLFWGLEQTNQNHDFTEQNYGVELSQIGVIGAHWSFRTIMSMSQNYEPYYEWGAGALFKPQEGLGSLINYDRYQARVGAGFEDLLHRKRTLRLGGEAALGTLGFTLLLRIGYTIPD